MQIKLGMKAFLCDNYGFICKLSLRLMLRDIKMSSDAAIRGDHMSPGFKEHGTLMTPKVCQ